MHRISFPLVVGFIACGALRTAAQTDWPTFGHDLAGTRYSPLNQINPANVARLKRVWTFHMSADLRGDAGPTAEAMEAHGPIGRAGESTPLVVNGRMYLTTPYNQVVALEPETGKLIWAYALKGGNPAVRGLEFYAGDKQSPPQVVFGTSDAKLISLNAETGKAVPGFGNEGIVDLKQGVLNGFPNAFYDLSSPPIIYRDLVITGAHTQESPSLGAAGDTRAWDMHTGKLIWQFHSVPQPGEVGHDTWEGDSWKGRSGTNVWGMMTVDSERGIVYMPFGQSTYDYWGGDRKGANLFGNSLVALDAKTGKLRWYFQSVHHDTWDYDISGPPVLLDVVRNGRKIPAVAEIGKTALLYILDRRTGKPIYGVEERPVPASDVEGEQSWPTQPFPLKPGPLARNSFQASEIAKVTPEHQKYCTELLANENGMHNLGPFTPYGATLSVVFPGTLGGSNWNPMSFDPKLGYLFINTQDLGSIGKVVKNKEGSRTPYARVSPLGPVGRFWDRDKGWPCQEPPWGRLFAVNVNTGEIAWESVLGVTDDLPAEKQKTGRPNIGGSLATAGGLVFIGATTDSRFRAFESTTGKELWVTKLDASAHSAPMTFRGKDGKQYVVIVGTGGGFLADTPSADVVTAFALP
jgi:quinoprotein glucose dehydrogenase